MDLSEAFKTASYWLQPAGSNNPNYKEPNKFAFGSSHALFPRHHSQQSCCPDASTSSRPLVSRILRHFLKTLQDPCSIVFRMACAGPDLRRHWRRRGTHWEDFRPGQVWRQGGPGGNAHQLLSVPVGAPHGDLYSPLLAGQTGWSGTMFEGFGGFDNGSGHVGCDWAPVGAFSAVFLGCCATGFGRFDNSIVRPRTVVHVPSPDPVRTHLHPERCSSFVWSEVSSAVKSASYVKRPKKFQGLIFNVISVCTRSIIYYNITLKTDQRYLPWKFLRNFTAARDFLWVSEMAKSWFNQSINQSVD